MITQLRCLHPETPVKEAVQLLIDDEFSGLPVIDEKQQFVGVFTEQPKPA